MKKRIGRPTENPKEYIIKFRVDKETQMKLDFCTRILELNRSETIRSSISNLYDQLFYINEVIE